MFTPTSERSVARHTEDGYRTLASTQFGDRVKLTIKHPDGSTAFDVLNAEDRAGLAAFLLAGLPLDLVRGALPTDLFTTDWAVEVTEGENVWRSEEDGLVWASREAVETESALHEGGRIVRREVSNWMEG